MKPHYPTRTDTRITSRFGWRTHPVTKQRQSHHDGTDFAPRIPGTPGVPVYAVADGTVRDSRYNAISGQRIYIEHSQDSYTSVYMHLAERHVKHGQKVKRGQRIGTMGTSGRSTGIHLHFGISKTYPVVWSSGTRLGSFIDPIPYLNKEFPSEYDKLEIDGDWGSKTTRRLQQYFNTKIDGIISGQPNNQSVRNIPSAKVGKSGSLLIQKMQQWLGTSVDGKISDPSLMIRALQRRFGTTADGHVSKPSLMVKELQRRLNNNKL